MKENQLLPRERVMEALAGKEPDRVPWIELELGQMLVDKMLGKPTTAINMPNDMYNRGIEDEKKFSRLVGKDNVQFCFRPPIFCDFEIGKDNRYFYGKGHIQTHSDLDKIVLPDLGDKNYLEPAKQFVKNKEEFAAMAATRLGFAAVMLSMGMENFFESLYRDKELILEVLDRYTKWLLRAVEIISNIGFDFIAACDDMAIKTGPMISPKMIEEIFFPSMKKVADAISIPFFTHSDGDMFPLMEMWLNFGQNAIHPVEPAAMDIREVKKQYGSKICIIGNVDVDLLAQGTAEEVDKAVRDLIRNIAPGGGYILSSGNMLTDYSKVENIWAMSKALKKYGRYPIEV